MTKEWCFFPASFKAFIVLSHRWFYLSVFAFLFYLIDYLASKLANDVERGVTRGCLCLIYTPLKTRYGSSYKIQCLQPRVCTPILYHSKYLTFESVKTQKRLQETRALKGQHSGELFPETDFPLDENCVCKETEWNRKVMFWQVTCILWR